MLCVRWPQTTAPEGQTLTQADVAHNKVADVERHEEDQDQQNDAQVQFPVEVTGAARHGRARHEEGRGGSCHSR